MFQLRKARGHMRPWIAMVAAYALALQVLLNGHAAGHFMPNGETSVVGDLFIICHGSGKSSDDQDLPDKQPLPRSPCVLCTLTQTPCAILPVDHDIARIPAIAVSNVVPRNDGRIFQYDSPTGQYQRGPPLRAVIFG